MSNLKQSDSRFCATKNTLQLLNIKHLNGYTLTTGLIRGGLGRLDLNHNAKEVLLYLSTCYNPKNGVVYPRVKTMAVALGISERGVIRAIGELIKSGCILKSKKHYNANVYVLTQKVLTASNCMEAPEHDMVSSVGDNDISKETTSHLDSDTVSLSCEVKQNESEINKQQVEKKEEQVKPNVVVCFSNSFKGRKHVTLDDIPLNILNNSKIRNKLAYWASLTKEQKEYYCNQQKEIDNKTQLRVKQEKEEAREREEAQKESRKPISEWEYESAKGIYVNLRSGIWGRKSELAKNLVKTFPQLLELGLEPVE